MRPAQGFSACDGDIRAWIEQGAIHLKAVDGTDPVEMTESDALKLAHFLVQCVNFLKQKT